MAGAQALGMSGVSNAGGPGPNAAPLREALGGPSLEMRYQPLVRLRDGATIGLEALARLIHPGRGVLSPDQFMPLIEEAGLIAEFTDAITRRALADLAGFGAIGATVAVLVNYPLDVLLVSEALARLEARRRAAGIPPARLVIELTERHPVTDLAALSQSMDTVRARGCQLALDDIVPELPGLEALVALPFTFLKLDRSVVLGAREPGPMRDFVLRLRQHTRLNRQRLVAEGVEDAAILEHARAMEFDAVQGFHIGRPMAAADVPGWLRAHPAGSWG